ncbi:MAG: AarF/ABC1/UbiB kinase family protein [Alphaproteobacteria bacterium]|nr:AarF/ABC1/UbiB kinase family protein [Alphaproteobacteria bacterium]
MKIVRPVVNTVGGVTTRVRDLNRLQQIARILVGHGLGAVVRAIPGMPDAPDEIATTPARAATMLKELGPTFVKLGQVLSTRPDVLPEAYCKAFEQLQDDVGPLTPVQLENQLADHLGEDWRSHFERFDEQPLATASIAQVHRARLTDGREIVVKIQRPGIAAKIRADLNILHVLAWAVISEFPEARSFDPRGILVQFERSITAELDFLQEAQNMKRFARNFAGSEDVRIPFVVDELTSESVLAMEFFDGVPIRRARQAGFDMDHVGATYLRAAYDMLFVHGFFHGDLHPGNVLVLEGNRLGLLDFGMVGTLTREMRNNVLSILMAAQRGDYRTIARLFYEIAIKDERVDYPAMERDSIEVLERNLTSDNMRDIQIGRLVTDLANGAAKHGARVPLAYTMFFKALLTSEGLAKSLLHEQNPIAAAQPYFERMLLETFGPERMQEELHYYGLTLTSLGSRLPVAVAQFLEDLDHQRLGINVRNHMDPVEEVGRERRLNRAIVAGSAFTMTLTGGVLGAWTFLAVPWLSLIFFALAVPLWGLLAWMVWRSPGSV